MLREKCQKETYNKERRTVEAETWNKRVLRHYIIEEAAVNELEIRFVERGICLIAESIMTDTVISVRRRNFDDSAKGYIAHFFQWEIALFLLPVWNLWSEIWHHRHIPRSWFPVGHGNFGDLQTFKAEICMFTFAWIFRTFWNQNGGLWWQNMGGMMWC